jgi:hypothetical protein
MHTWNPEPTKPARPIDRPAVAFILTVALALGALVGLYAVHVTSPQRDAKLGAARTPIVYRLHGVPTGEICRGVIIRLRNGRMIPTVPCHVSTSRRGTA